MESESEDETWSKQDFFMRRTENRRFKPVTPTGFVLSFYKQFYLHWIFI